MRSRKLTLILTLLLFPLCLLADNLRISGTVVDSEKEPIPGVVVMLTDQNSGTGTITDIDGHFYIEVPSKSSVLCFQCLGYKTVTETVGDRINIDVQLYEDNSELDEAVVVSYGKQKKLSVIGSIQNIEPDKLQTGTARSISNNLAGQVSGVIAIKPSGEPGYDNSDFWIRGVASFSGNTSPLVLVDGVERSLNNIDPSEIESFSVLKDASASAMYGVRGANGVIIINTKRGKNAPPKVEFRAEAFVQTPTKLPEFLGAPEYMALLNELSPLGQRMFRKDAIIKTYTGYDRDIYPDTDWIDAITNEVAYGGRANVGVSGGSDRIRYAVNASYYNETGIMARDESLPYDTSSKLARYNLRANMDIDLTSTTLLRVSIGGYLQQLRKANSSTDEVFAKAFETPPFVHPAIYSDGTIPISTVQRYNPWAMATQYGYYNDSRSQIESTFGLEQNLKFLLPGLKVRALFSFDAFNQTYVTRNASPNFYSTALSRDDEGNLVHTILKYGSSGLGHSNSANYGNNSTYFEAAVTYDQSFGQHDVNALFLYNMRSYSNGDIQPFRTQGIAGRISYTYARRYVGEFNFGYNGSENFAKGHRFGFFPSVALGWVISEEPFFSAAKNTVTKLKLRGSVGSVGNDNIGSNRRFAYITTINGGASGYNFGYDGSNWYGGVSEGEIGVTNLTWERATKMNLGLEFGLMYDLDLQLDVFKEIRNSIFMQRNTIPSQSGFLSTPYANYGKVENHGVEAQLSYTKRFSQDWSLNLRGSFTYAHNTILECDEPKSVIGTHRSITGQSIGTLWGLTADGLYTKDDFDVSTGKLKEGIPTPKLSSQYPRPGDIKYIDKNNDGYITNEDEGFIGGTETPEIIYGFGASVNFYGFDLSFFFQGSGLMYRVIGGSDYFIPGSGQGVLGNCYANYYDRWTEDNPSQNVFWPRLSQTTNPNNNTASTWWKKDMSFLRCKTIELGYSMPERLAKKAHMSLARIFVSINNPFYISKFKLWDPELATNDGLRYPSMRSAMLGLNINF